MRKKKERFSVPTSGKMVHEKKLLTGRALIVVKMYLDHDIDEDTHKNAVKLFTDYKHEKAAVIAAIKSSLRFLLKVRFDLDDPTHIPQPNPMPTPERIKETKKYLNALAKKILK